MVPAGLALGEHSAFVTELIENVVVECMFWINKVLLFCVQH
jgi:hypothetical protein